MTEETVPEETETVPPHIVTPIIDVIALTGSRAVLLLLGDNTVRWAVTDEPDADGDGDGDGEPVVDS